MMTSTIGRAGSFLRSAPPHSEAEIRRIFPRLNHPEVDPRIALALELGAEARLGQVVRIMRSDIDLSEIGAFRLGGWSFTAQGRKSESPAISRRKSEPPSIERSPATLATWKAPTNKVCATITRSSHLVG